MGVAGTHAEVSPRGQSQNKEEARSHQGSPRVALQGAKRSPQCKKRRAGPAPGPGGASTHMDWVASPPGSTWRYLGISGDTSASFSLSS